MPRPPARVMAAASAAAAAPPIGAFTIGTASFIVVDQGVANTSIPAILDRVLPRLVLHRDPVVGGELVQCPLSAETPDARTLHAAERGVGVIVDRRVVDVRHPRLDPPREPHRPLYVPAEHRRREPVL